MPLRRLCVAALSLGVLAWAPLSAAQSVVPAKPAQALEAAQARQWVQRLHQAASQRNYSGTQVFTGGGAVSSARVAHYCEGPQQFESVEMLDGQMRRVLRHNDVVYTLWPKRQVAVIEQRPALVPFPALLQRGGGDRRRPRRRAGDA